MNPRPTRRRFLAGFLTGLLGLWAGRRARAAAAPATTAPLPAAPRTACPHPRLRSTSDPRSLLRTTTYDAGPCRRCRAAQPFLPPSAFVYDGRARPLA